MGDSGLRYFANHLFDMEVDIVQCRRMLANPAISEKQKEKIRKRMDAEIEASQYVYDILQNSGSRYKAMAAYVLLSGDEKISTLTASDPKWFTFHVTKDVMHEVDKSKLSGLQKKIGGFD